MATSSAIPPGLLGLAVGVILPQLVHNSEGRQFGGASCVLRHTARAATLPMPGTMVP